MILSSRPKRFRHVTPVSRENIGGVAPRDQGAVADPPDLIRAALEKRFIVGYHGDRRARAAQLHKLRHGSRFCYGIGTGKRVIEKVMAGNVRNRITRPEADPVMRGERFRAFVNDADDTAVGRNQAFFNRAQPGKFDHAMELLSSYRSSACLNVRSDSSPNRTTRTSSTELGWSRKPRISRTAISAACAIG